MSRERRSSIAIGVAVFIAGGVLLGLEIASSRVLAPSLRQLALRLGRADRRRARGPVDRLLARRRHRRPLAAAEAARRPARGRRAARARDPVRRRLGARPRRRLGSRPAPEPARRHDPPLRHPERRPRHGLARRRPPEGAVARAPRPDRRPALRGLDGGLDRRDVPDRVLADPGARHRPGARFGRRRADARRGRGRARRAAARSRSALALALAGASVGAVVSLAPESGGDRAASQLRNWSPVYRQQAPASRLGGIEDTQTGYKILHTKDSQYHRIAVVEDDDSRYLRFDSSFQSGMYVDDPFKTRFGYSDYLQLPFAYRRADEAGALRRARRRLGAQADLARLPGRADRRGRARSRGRRAPRTSTSRCRATRGCRSTVEDGRRFLAANEGPWDVDRRRRLLLRLDPVPPRDPRVPRARALAARPGGLVAANIIGAVTGSDSRLFRSMLRTYRAVFPTVNIHPVIEAGGRDLETIRNIILVAGDGAAPSKEFLLERWRDVRRTLARRARPRRRRSAAASTRPSRRRTFRCSRTTTRRPTRCCSCRLFVRKRVRPRGRVPSPP